MGPHQTSRDKACVQFDAEEVESVAIRSTKELLVAEIARMTDLKIAAVAFQEMAPHRQGDLTLFRWREWYKAHERLEQACRDQQLLETRVYSLVQSDASSSDTFEVIGARLGYSEAKRAEEAASAIEERKAEALWLAPACSPHGIAAKLFSTLKRGAPSEDSMEFPWPQLRALLRELQQLYL